MKVIERNMSYEVTPTTHRENKELIRFTKTLNTYTRSFGSGKMKFEVKDGYYLHREVSDSYFFLDKSISDLLYQLRSSGYNLKEDLDITVKATKEYPKVKHRFKSPYKPRAKQKHFIDAMLDSSVKRVFVNARTGYGKTYMACYVINKLKVRPMIYIRPTYIDKWISDLNEYFDIKDGELFVIKGSDSLRELMEIDIKKVKYIIASNTTMFEYFKKFRDGVDFDYKYTPIELLERLGVGFLLSDESHQFFYNLFLGVTLLNPVKMVGLSATLITKDSRLNHMYHLLFPKESRAALNAYDNHIDIIFCSYNIIDADRLYYKRGKYGYAHKRFEQSILERGYLRVKYLNLIKRNVNQYYIKRKKKGEKLLVYASSLVMIDTITKFLKKEYPDLDVRKYIGGSDYSNVLEPDIRVSHPDKSGAAIDIPDLITVLNTVNIDSPNMVIQMAGRLREIEGRPTTYVQLYTPDIRQHKLYAVSNAKYMSEIAKSINWKSCKFTL